MTTDFIKLCWAIFVLVWIVAARRLKPVQERQSWRSRSVLVVFLIAAFSVLGARIGSAWLNVRVLPDAPAVRLMGDAITFLGLAAAIWARCVLGGNWSVAVTFKQGHELIERGPYRWVRHPIYTGLLLMILGTAIVVGRVGGLAALLIGFLVVWLKLRLEEALLTRHFPEAYAGYRARTKALIPFVF
jgi:protein-S-isoprenylcysteine O-methyltransferase Ste14